MTNYNSNKTQGFTLLEILAVLAIFSMLSVAMFSVVNTTVNAHGVVINQNKQLTDLQRAFTIIENDFTQLAQRKVRIDGEDSGDTFFHASDYLFESEAVGFAFVRDGWTNPAMVLARSELQLVAYRLIEKKLERLYFNFVDNEMGTEPRVQVLINGIEAMSLSYHVNGEWGDELPETGLPSAIKLKLETETFGEIERSFLIIRQTVVEIKNDN
jgi:general secretion pathway protein J